MLPESSSSPSAEAPEPGAGAAPSDEKPEPIAYEEASPKSVMNSPVAADASPGFGAGPADAAPPPTPAFELLAALAAAPLSAGALASPGAAELAERATRVSGDPGGRALFL